MKRVQQNISAVNFAIVELKYDEKKMFVVSTDCIKDFKPKYSPMESFLCFISTDITEEPNFSAPYFKTFDGRSGIFKVFIRKITGTKGLLL